MSGAYTRPKMYGKPWLPVSEVESGPQLHDYRSSSLNAREQNQFIYTIIPSFPGGDSFLQQKDSGELLTEVSHVVPFPDRRIRQSDISFVEES